MVEAQDPKLDPTATAEPVKFYSEKKSVTAQHQHAAKTSGTAEP